MKNRSYSLLIFFIYFFSVSAMDFSQFSHDIYYNIASRLTLDQVIQFSYVNRALSDMKDELYWLCNDTKSKALIAEDISEVYDICKDRYPKFTNQLRLLYIKLYFDTKSIQKTLNLGFLIEKPCSNYYKFYIEKNKKFFFTYEIYSVNHLNRFKSYYRRCNRAKTIFSIIDAHKKENLLDFFNPDLLFDMQTLENFLIKAIKTENYYVIKELLKREVKVSVNSFIRMICQTDNPKIVSLIIKDNPNHVKKYLFKAISLKKIAIVTSLLQRYPINDENYVSKQIYNLIKDKNEVMLRLLLTHSLDLIPLEKMRDYLSFMCKYANQKIFNLFLEFYPDSSIDFVSDTGETFLFYAVKKHDLQMVRFLLHKGLDPNQKNNWGKTPIVLAFEKYFDRSFCFEEEVEIIALLLNYTTNSSILKIKNLFPLEYKRYKKYKKKLFL